jgi:hypothetical protein
MLVNYKAEIMNMVLAEHGTRDTCLPCPFQRRNPKRYRHVKDHACKGNGFKDIADLR